MSKRKKYIFNIEAIANFVIYSDKNFTIEREITDGYGDETDAAISKIVREVKSAGNAQIDTIRYDLVKLLMEQVLGELAINDYDIETSLAFQTLLHYNFIKEV